MRILTFGPDTGTSIERFGSIGFSVTHLARSMSSLTCLRLEAGGVIGRHPAVGRQLFCVVDGGGTVTGEDDRPIPITAGQAALWEPGEPHETRTATGLVAIVAEGPDVEVVLPSR